MSADKPLGQRIRAAADNVREKTRWKNAAKRRKDNASTPEEYKRRLSVLEKLRKALANALTRLKGLRKRRKPKPAQANFNGHPTNVSPLIREVIVEANRMGLYVTSTTDGTHSPGSYHYSGRGVDVAAPMTTEGINKMKAFQRFAVKKWPNALENFGPEPYYHKNGLRYPGTFPNHHNHCHIAR